PAGPLVEPADEVAEDDVALRLVEDLVEQAIVLLELLVLAGRVIEELARRLRVGDGIGAAAQEQQRGHELGRAPEYRLLRFRRLGEPARRRDLLVERIIAGRVLDGHVPGELLGLELVSNRQR